MEIKDFNDLKTLSSNKVQEEQLWLAVNDKGQPQIFPGFNLKISNRKLRHFLELSVRW